MPTSTTTITTAAKPAKPAKPAKAAQATKATTATANSEFGNLRPAVGRSLPQEYYVSSEWFQRDVKMYGATQWLLVDHVSKIPSAGDWFTYEFGSNSIIVVRNKEGEINAFYNVCRHRGSILCAEGSAGKTKTLTCAYHSWSYDLDGNLRPPRSMPEDFDKKANGLVRCHIRVYDGLIFINLAKGNPPDFDVLIGDLKPFLDLHELQNAKVAYSKKWIIDANWKLNVENFLECYHCRAAHPTYTAVHDAMKLLSFGAGAGSSDKAVTNSFEARMKEWEAETNAKGIFTGIVVDGVDSDFFRAAARIPIKDGYKSETRDGTPGSTLMGKFREFDGGQTGVSFNATATIIANNDFALMFRYTPIDTLKTELVVSWIVHKDAVEGQDYDVEKISAVWAITLDEDKTITQNNQKGIQSTAYQPGVYSTQEQRIADFTQWYINRLERFESETAADNTILIAKH